MRAQEPSQTSMIAAIARGQHRELHDRPWVLDDPFALVLAGPAWPEIFDRLSTIFREPVRDEGVGAIVARSRHAEERVVGGDFAQYVVLGAGLDSFAWRRPDVLSAVRVIEVDHPATQLWKRDRATVLALPANERHVFAPVDFETQTLREGLDAVGFDWSRPTVFSWLGVVPYLTTAAIEGTLRDVARCAPGSEIVFTYAPTDELIDDIGREFLQILSGVAAASGEPIQSLLAPGEAEAMVAACGLQVMEHLDASDLHARYFGDRADGLRPYTVERLITARVPA